MRVLLDLVLAEVENVSEKNDTHTTAPSNTHKHSHTHTHTHTHAHDASLDHTTMEKTRASMGGEAGRAVRIVRESEGGSAREGGRERRRSECGGEVTR